MNTQKDKEYTAPLCKVYSINLEGAIAQFSSGDEVDPSPEDEWGGF